MPFPILSLILTFYYSEASQRELRLAHFSGTGASCKIWVLLVVLIRRGLYLKIAGRWLGLRIRTSNRIPSRGLPHCIHSSGKTAKRSTSVLSARRSPVRLLSTTEVRSLDSRPQRMRSTPIRFFGKVAGLLICLKPQKERSSPPTPSMMRDRLLEVVIFRTWEVHHSRQCFGAKGSLLTWEHCQEIVSVKHMRSMITGRL